MLLNTIIDLVSLILTSTIFFCAWHIGRKGNLNKEVGWSAIIAGFGVIMVADLVLALEGSGLPVDLIIPSIVSGLPYLVMTLLYLTGYLLLLYGGARWLPLLIERRRFEQDLLHTKKCLSETVTELQKHREDLKELVDERTKDLQKVTRQLEKQNVLLNEKNIALREVMGQLEQEKDSIEDRIRENVNRIMIPALEKLKEHGTSFESQYLDFLGSSLKDLLSSFGQKLTSSSLNLTQREIEVCNLIKNGFTSKEIGKYLNISYRTVETLRYRIRKKLGIINQDINLYNYMQTL